MIALLLRLLPRPFLIAACSLAMLPVALLADTTLNVIHTFTPASDGNVPFAPLVQGTDGRFYGVCTTGGRSSNGTIFALSANGGGFTVLNTFTQSNQGTQPQGGLVQGRDGNFYGTTYNGGSNGTGTLFQVLPTTGKLNILAQFNNGNPGGNPVGTLIEGLDGFLYGTAKYGGTNNYGTVFRADESTGATAPLAVLTGGLAGLYPESDLIQGSDGNFYGSTFQGGTSNLGTFFQLTPAGVYTILYSFTGNTDGSSPVRGVVQGANGAFYGVATAGGAAGSGVIYRITVSGTTASFSTLHTFYPLIGEGSTPNGNLLLASDGNFYGTTSAGGTSLNGTVYRITYSGGFTTLYNFTGGTDGSYPIGTLTQGSDGRIFGTTAGQSGSAGTIFRLDLGLTPPAPAPLRVIQATAANIGDTVLIKGDNFIGATGVAFTGANATTVPADSFTVLSKTVIQAVVPAGAVSGEVSVTGNGQTGFTLYAFTVNVPPPVVVLPTVTVTAIQPVASKANGTVGRFKVIRTGDTSAALTVSFKIPVISTAVFGTDYTLVCKGVSLGTTGTFVIPAGKASVAVKVIPVRTTTVAPLTDVFIKIRKSTVYLLGNPLRAEVQITSEGQ